MKWLPIAAVACLFLAACSGDSKPKPTRTPAGTIAEAVATPRPCPVDDDICAFARTVESEARAGTLASVFPGATRELGDRARDMLAVTGGEPRVVSLGCPLVNNTLDCKQSFAVTVTSVPDEFIERYTRGLVAIFFSRSTPPPPFALFEAPRPVERRLFIDGGERDFDAGIDRGGETPHWRFVKFATGARVWGRPS